MESNKNQEINSHKEKIGKNPILPTEEEEKNIMKKFNDYLFLLNDNKINIREISNYFCEQYNKYNNYFFEIFISLILQNVQATKKIEYLDLTIDIINKLNENRINNNITTNELNYLLLCIKDICRNYHYAMNDQFIKYIKNSLNNLKQSKIYDEIDIDSIMMELRLTTEPNVLNNDKDKNCLNYLLNDKILKIDMDMINLYKDIDFANRGNINSLRMNLIKKENELIEKQISLYNKNIVQIKHINEMIDKINKKFPGIK